jgi:hypothetical protein
MLKKSDLTNIFLLNLYKSFMYAVNFDAKVRYYMSKNLNSTQNFIIIIAGYNLIIEKYCD